MEERWSKFDALLSSSTLVSFFTRFHVSLADISPSSSHLIEESSDGDISKARGWVFNPMSESRSVAAATAEAFLKNGLKMYPQKHVHTDTKTVKLFTDLVLEWVAERARSLIQLRQCASTEKSGPPERCPLVSLFSVKTGYHLRPRHQPPAPSVHS